MASDMTYAEVRDWVIGQAGDACQSQQGLELLMRNCLTSMRNKLGPEEERKRLTLTIPKGTSEIALPSGVEKVLSVVDDSNCEIPKGNPPCLPCEAGVLHSGKPASYEVIDGKLVVHPATEEDLTLKLVALSEIDCTLYDTDAAGVRNWRNVALPASLHSVYAKCVLGMALVDSEPGRAQNWLTISDTEFNEWRNRFATASSGRTLVWGKREHSCGGHCGCSTKSESLNTIKAGGYGYR